jgi:hypothetical protein
VNNDVSYPPELQALRGFYNVVAEAHPVGIDKSPRAAKDLFTLYALIEYHRIVVGVCGVCGGRSVSCARQV